VVLYQFFFLSPLQCTVLHYRNCKKLREFEEIEISRQSFKGDSELQGGKLLRHLSGFRSRLRPLHKTMEYDFLDEGCAEGYI